MKPSLLSHQDPEVSNVTLGESSIILSGPHNGWHVPAALINGDKPLGVPAWWFDPEHPEHRHEACDWGMTQLFDVLKTKIPGASVISSNYSRLVCDKNRIKDHTITPYSSEHGKAWPIPGNHGLTIDDLELRHEIYDAYMADLDALIEDVREQHGGAILLDLHSFSSIWHGHDRAGLEVGTITIKHNPLFEIIGKELEGALGQRFAQNSPYDLRDENNKALLEGNLGHELMRKHDIWHNILEFRNDTLRDAHRLNEFGDLLAGVVQRIENHPYLDHFLSRDHFEHDDMQPEQEPPSFGIA